MSVDLDDRQERAIERAEYLADVAEHFMQMVVNAALDNHDEQKTDEQIDVFVDDLKDDLLRLRDAIIDFRFQALRAKLPPLPGTGDSAVRQAHDTALREPHDTAQRADDISVATRDVARGLSATTRDS